MVLAIALGATEFACESGPADDAAVPASDGGAPPGSSCSAVTCVPPACCGQACGANGTCCAGTTCSPNGRCVPALCATCGELGCIVDLTACTAACARPSCCLQFCATDGDCCPATRCRPDRYGTKHCVPNGCDACAGFRPVCDVSAACELSCQPPLSCGTRCTNDHECGAPNLCHQFLDGSRFCVPAVFESTCNACGPRGCVFHPDRCAIDCAPEAPPDSGVPRPPDAASSSDDGGPPPDAAMPGAIDAAMAPAPVDASAAGDLNHAAAACKSCCARCTSDAECCADSRCQPDGKGHTICAPAACLQCANGCRFTCP